MFGIPFWIIAAGAGWYIGQEHPLVGWSIIVAVTVSTLVLIGSPALGLGLVGGLVALLALYIFIRFLPIILGLAFGLVVGFTFVFALIQAIGSVIGH